MIVTVEDHVEENGERVHNVESYEIIISWLQTVDRTKIEPKRLYYFITVCKYHI